MSMNTVERLSSLISNVIQVDEVPADATPVELGMDSVAQVEFSVKMEDVFGLSFEAGELTRSMSVSQIAAVVDKKLTPVR